MPLPITNHTLEKLELLFKDIGYQLRFEKGNFKTGACIIQNSKIIVVNKFFNLENKINSLVELIKTLEVDDAVLSEKQKTFFYTLKQTSLQL